MTKKHQIHVPSLSKSVPGKVTWVPLTTSLEKHNVALLKEHGYQVEEQVFQLKYKTLPLDKFNNYKLYLFMLLQDILRGSFFNKYRYPYFLIFLKNIYNVNLSKKQLDTYNKFLKENDMCTINDSEGNFSKISSDISLKTERVKKIILFSSNTVGIGKTTTSKKLSESLEDSLTLSFMNSTRTQLYAIFTHLGLDGNYWKEPLYSQNKNIKQNFNSDYDEFVQRSLLCDYSDLIQKHLGKNCWAKVMSNTISKSDFEYFIIDDLRRPIELDQLVKDFGKENILTVYLTKENAKEVALSTTSSNYEGLLDPSTFDIQFKFTENWNNTDELIKTIKSKLVH